MSKVSKTGTGVLVASVYSVGLTALFLRYFGSRPPMRFMDAYLLGTMLVAYYFGRRAALPNVIASVAAGLWILPPYGSFQITEDNVYRLISYVIISIAALAIIRSPTKDEVAPV